VLAPGKHNAPFDFISFCCRCGGAPGGNRDYTALTFLNWVLFVSSFFYFISILLKIQINEFRKAERSLKMKSILHRQKKEIRRLRISLKTKMSNLFEG